MYDKEKGVYPEGSYLIGKDLPIGGYILTAKNREEKGSVTLYKNYKSFTNEENEFLWHTFSDDYHLSLNEEKIFMIVENANIQKI